MINHDNPSILDFSECGMSLKDLIVLSMMVKIEDEDVIVMSGYGGRSEDEIEVRKDHLLRKIKGFYNIAEIALMSRKEHILESNKEEHSK